MDKLLNALQDAIEMGKYEEREMMINTLEAALKEFPDVRVDHFIPPLLDQLKALPAPQTWIDMQRARQLFPNDEAFKQSLNRKARRRKNK